MSIFRRKQRRTDISKGSPALPPTSDLTPTSDTISLTRQVIADPRGPQWVEPAIVTAEDRVRNIPSDSYGLHPHELLMLSYAPTFTTDDQRFQQFWWYQYGVRDPRALLACLTDRGFIRVGEIDHAVSRQTAAALKQLLRECNLKVSGKKSELVDRVLISVPHDVISAAFPQRHYMLTVAGTEGLAASDHISYIHRSRHLDGLDIFSLSAMRAEHPGRPWRDLIWGHLNQQSIVHAQADDWGLYRNVRWGMAEFRAEEGSYTDGVRLLGEVAYYDTSGMHNGFRLEYLSERAEFLFPYGKGATTLPPALVPTMYGWADKAGLDEAALRGVLRESLDRLDARFHAFTKDEVLEIIFLEHAEETDALTALYAQAEQRFNDKDSIGG